MWIAYISFVLLCISSIYTVNGVSRNVEETLRFSVPHKVADGSSTEYVNDSLKFMVIGDWGGLPFFPYRTPVESAVANRMGIFANQTKTEFILALGDNFYYSGVKNIEDPRFQETYNHVFTATSLDVEWYFVAGNHDHNGNVSAQIAYTNLEKRWMFPNYYYNLKFNVGKSSSTVEIIMLDTVQLCGNSDHDKEGKQPDGNISVKEAEDQWTWLEDKLKTSKANYLIVAGHYPVLSIAEHGPTKCLVDRLMKMLYKYNVTAYFSGHDHNLQHLQYSMNGQMLDYFVSGCANFIDPSEEHKNSVPAGSLKFHWAEVLGLGGFGFVDVSPTELMFSFIEANGKLLHRQKISPRKL